MTNSLSPKCFSCGVGYKPDATYDTCVCEYLSYMLGHGPTFIGIVTHHGVTSKRDDNRNTILYSVGEGGECCKR